MKTKNDNLLTIFSLLSLVFLITACNSSEKGVFTHRVERINYVDFLMVKGEIEPAQTKNITTPSLRTDAKISFLVPNGEFVEKGDTICILDAAQIENRYQQAATNLENAKAELKKTQAMQSLNIQLLKAEKKTIEASTAIRKLDTIQQKFVSRGQKQIIDLELKKADIQLQKVINRLSSLEKINKSEIHQREIQIQLARNQLQSSEQALNRLTILAPKAGMVLRGRSHSNAKYIAEGDVVWGSQLIAHMPNTSTYQVKFQLSEGEYKKIEKGYIYTANPEGQKLVKGKIKKKASIGKPISRKSKVKQFEVTATVDSLNFVPKPGQTLSCKIQTKQISDAIVLPLLSVFAQDSIRVVYVLCGNKFDQREVKVVYQNGSEAVITGDIESGSGVALTQPSKRKILKKK